MHAYTCGKIALFFAYTCGHVSLCEHIRGACVSIFALAFECIIGMIAPMCAYTCGQNSAHACMYMQAKIPPLGAYSTRACRNENIRANNTRPNLINLKGMAVCMHIREQECL